MSFDIPKDATSITNVFYSKPEAGWKETYNAIMMPSEEKIIEGGSGGHRTVGFSKTKAAVIVGLTIPVGLAIVAMGVAFLACSIFIIPSALAAGIVLVTAGMAALFSGSFSLFVGCKGLVTLYKSFDKLSIYDADHKSNNKVDFDL